jgi:hypothetical protein
MRAALVACLLLAACGAPDRPLGIPAAEVSTPSPAPTCGFTGSPCCYAKTGCTADPRGGADCVSPPDETSQGVCVKYGTCGNPGNDCCVIDGAELCEYNYKCSDEGRCVFQDL